jgi:hypothetical protein
MAFKNGRLNDLSGRFKKRFKMMIPNIKSWAMDAGISVNTAYSYTDCNRPDNHLPAFLLPTLPKDVMESVFQVLRDIADNKDTGIDEGNSINELMILYSEYLKDFSGVIHTLAEAMEDGKITEQEFETYDKARATFLAVDAKLHTQMLRARVFFDDDYYA